VRVVVVPVSFFEETRQMNRYLITALVACAGLSMSASAQITGPNAGASPYMLPAAPGVQFTSIATALTGQFYTNLDTGLANYRMVGIPDGMGIYRDEADLRNDTITVLMSHELGSTAGIVRGHGSTGAFVSQWTLRRSDFGVVGARDLTNSVNTFNTGTNSFVNGTTRFGRFCSADLAPVSAYQFTDNAGTTFGTSERIYLAGEEIGTEGRVFAHVLTGSEARSAWQLPDLARFSWENAVANPLAQRKTIVGGTDDSTPGQVYFYVGDKQAAGNAIEKAGLMNGITYGMRIPGVALEGAAPINSAFTMVDKSATQRGTGVAFQASSVALGVTEFARPEDAAWNPSNPSQMIWVNTGTSAAPTRIYSARFTDINNPELGGTVTMLGQGNDFSTFTGGVVTSSGTTTGNSFDNIAISRFNQVLIQEDVGSNDRLSRLWLYDITADSMLEIGIPDANRFLVGAANFLTRDEETSGIVDAWDTIGPGWWMLNMQAHYGIPGELVEGGQMMAVFIPQTIPTPGAVAVLGLGGLLVARRRRTR